LTLQKIGSYVRLASIYNYQRRTDSSHYYIQKVKDLEKKDKSSRSAWFSEAIYFILVKNPSTCYGNGTGGSSIYKIMDVPYTLSFSWSAIITNNCGNEVTRSGNAYSVVSPNF